MVRIFRCLYYALHRRADPVQLNLIKTAPGAQVDIQPLRSITRTFPGGRKIIGATNRGGFTLIKKRNVINCPGLCPRIIAIKTVVLILHFGGQFKSIT